MPASTHQWPEGLVIRAARVEDAAEMTALANLPGFRAGTLRMPYSRVEKTRQWLEGHDDNTCNLMAVLNGTIVGNAGLVRHSGRRNHSGNIGIGVHDDFVGRGIGRALLGELIDVADNWLGLARLELNVFTDNAVAIRLYESLGFQREGVFVGYALRDGVYVDSIAMARMRG